VFDISLAFIDLRLTVTRYAGGGSVIRTTIRPGPRRLMTRSANRTRRNISPYLVTMASFKSRIDCSSVRTSAIPPTGCTPTATLPRRLHGRSSTRDVCRSRLTLPVLNLGRDEQGGAARSHPDRCGDRLTGAPEGRQRYELLAPQPFEGHAHMANVPAVVQA
jgi:hypothetical protein